MPIKPEKTFVAALSYLWILCLVPLFLKRKDSFAQFHAKQGLLLFVIEIIGTIIFPIPFIGWILWVAVVVLSAVGFRYALIGEEWEMPILGKYAKKINI